MVLLIALLVAAVFSLALLVLVRYAGTVPGNDDEIYRR